MMQYRVHFEHADGTEDEIIVSGETLEEVRANAEYEVESRGGLLHWAEEIQ